MHLADLVNFGDAGFSLLLMIQKLITKEYN